MTSRQPQDEFHVTSAEEVVTALATQPAGLTQEEAGAMLSHLAFYAGWPKVFSALPVAKDVFESRKK